MEWDWLEDGASGPWPTVTSKCDRLLRSSSLCLWRAFISCPPCMTLLPLLLSLLWLWLWLWLWLPLLLLLLLMVLSSVLVLWECGDASRAPSLVAALSLWPRLLCWLWLPLAPPPPPPPLTPISVEWLLAVARASTRSPRLFSSSSLSPPAPAPPVPAALLPAMPPSS